MSELTSPYQRDAPDDSEMSGSRKKNNKLGYQRTSVACSHCRRRKIRCQPNEIDPGGPCMNCQRMKKECLTVPVQDPPGEKDRSRMKVAEASSTSMPVPIPHLVQSHSALSALSSEDAPRTQPPPESSYSSLPTQQPPITTYQGPIPAANYPLNDHSGATWSSPASALQNTAITSVSPQEPAYYHPQPLQYIPSASPSFDHSQHSLRHYPQSYAGSTAHSESYSVSSGPTRSTSYAGYQPQAAYPPMSAGPQYDNVRRTVTMPHASNMGASTGDSAYSSGMAYPGHTASGMNLPHHPTQEQYNAWQQYNQQQEPTYHEQHQTYDQHQWG